MCGYLSCAPYWGPGLQPRHMPWLGVKPVTLWFLVRSPCSIHWATSARAGLYNSYSQSSLLMKTWIFYFILFYFYSVTIICIFSPSLKPLFFCTVLWPFVCLSWRTRGGHQASCWPCPPLTTFLAWASPSLTKSLGAEMRSQFCKEKKSRNAWLGDSAPVWEGKGGYLFRCGVFVLENVLLKAWEEGMRKAHRQKVGEGRGN